jgi:hypothetical protein
VTGRDNEEAVTQEPGGAFSDSNDGDGLPPGADGRLRRRRHPVRTSLIVLTVAAVAAAGGIAATGALGGDTGTASEAAPSGPASTAEVKQATLTRSETVEGDLGYGDAQSVQASGGGSAGAGTITRLPGEGAVITRGQSVYSVNEAKVPLLYGAIPLYRTLGVDSEGDDVRQLEENLAALGYTGFTVDDEYTANTATAVKAWQEDLNRTESGKVAPGDAVVASGAKRIAEVKAALGTAVSGEILTWTGTQRLVTVDLEAQYEDLVKEGTKATVKLPDGTTADATVTRIGNAATAKPAASGDSSDTTTLPVTLSVKDQNKLGRYQAAPVDVTLTAETRKNVLAVPVNALIAREGGGYAVQAVTADGVENRQVKLGLFANGLVEISGAGITKGLKVGIPQ